MENNVYKLVLEIPPQKVGENTTTAPTTNGQTNGTESAKEEQGNGKKAALKTIAVVGATVNIVDRIASMYVNTTTLRTGFENQQAKYQMVQGFAKRGFSVVSSVVAGTIMAGGNPMGAIAGLAFGMTSQALDMMATSNEMSIARNIENTQIFLNSIRMGAGANRGNRE